MSNQSIDKYHRQTIEWHGYLIEVAYCRSWSPVYEKAYGYAMSHIEIWTLDPERAPLPITETGYRSHFVHEPVVAEAGGPVALVLEMLNDAAKKKEWKEAEESRKQLSLF